MSIRKKSLKTTLTGALICTAIAISTATADVPPPVIEISTFEELCKIGKDPGYPLHYVVYELMNDIDASPSGEMNDGKGFEPIGLPEFYKDRGFLGFQGVFNGNGHVIRNLYIYRPNEDGVGLFRALEMPPNVIPSVNTVVRDLGIEAAVIIGGSHVGVLAGLVDGYIGPLDADPVGRQAHITGCHVTGTVIATSSCVGGLIGDNRGRVTGSYAAVEVAHPDKADSRLHKKATFDDDAGLPAPNISIGGLIGYNQGTIDSCHATGNVRGIHNGVGGLVGHNRGRISRCYATGSASGAMQGVGGLVGRLSFGEGGSVIVDCYATGSATGGRYVGGLVGFTEGVRIINSYSTGTVGIINDYIPESPLPWGGLVGANLSIARVCVVSNSYWDITASGISFDNVCSSEGKTTAEMKQRSTFVDWDFTDVWRINEGESYPYLAWQDDQVVSISYNNRAVRNRANQFMPQVSVKGRTLNIKPSSAQSSPQNLQIRVIDMRGRAVHSRVVNNSVNTLSLTKIPAGRYIVEVKNSGVRVGSVPVVVR